MTSTGEHVLACARRRTGIAVFRVELSDHFAPSMRQRIDWSKLFNQACGPVNQMLLNVASTRSLPLGCPVTLDQAIGSPLNELETAFAAAISAV